MHFILIYFSFILIFFLNNYKIYSEFEVWAWPLTLKRYSNIVNSFAVFRDTLDSFLFYFIFQVQRERNVNWLHHSKKFMRKRNYFCLNSQIRSYQRIRIMGWRVKLVNPRLYYILLLNRTIIQFWPNCTTHFVIKILLSFYSRRSISFRYCYLEERRKWINW